MFERHNEFLNRHIPHDDGDIADMLATMGLDSLDHLIDETVPATIRLDKPLSGLPAPLTEQEALAKLAEIAAKNTPSAARKSLIGMGYYDTWLPNVLLRNVLENPGWYTAYTPYQAEIAQGRLEALLNYQQMVIDLTGLPLANASLLDEATAAAEAMAMARRISKSASNAFFVDEDAFPQTLDVLKTRAGFFGFDLIFGPAHEATSYTVFGAFLQTPNARGECVDFTSILTTLKNNGVITVIATDIMASVLLKSPGDMGTDIALGSAQRFGLPLGFGGPHAAFFACRDEHKRAMPGRIIGVSVDARGRPALRLALQTREQHIRREKANSNICTSQVLLANLAGMVAMYHGPEGLRTIARRIHHLTGMLAEGLKTAGIKVLTSCFFDTLHIETQVDVPRYNLRRVSDTVRGISLDETTTRDDVAALLRAFTETVALTDHPSSPLTDLLRTDAILTHPVFNTYHSEHEMLRYLKKLQNRDLALDHSMIPLGSCTMKLNATSQMIPVTWPAFANLHPFVPLDQAAGSLEMIQNLEHWLALITGFDHVCMQPNSGAQGEYAGLVTIRRYQAAKGEEHRNICLIPKSAHGTNPATAQMCGLQVVVIDCDERGNVDVTDLKEKAARHAANLSCLMMTYPSTHGVFEEAIMDICALVHAHGGQVYMDGANMNAQVGLTSPGRIGADVAHLNLHKTFAVPHGGGGPGMGPIGLKAHLVPYQPGHVSLNGSGAVSAAPWGSASILTISWMYITLLGASGLTQATRIAILNANYVATRLKDHYPVLYTGAQKRVAHECILDVRAIKAATGISEIDIAKRLMDYGFHAPTVSFPVAGTLMVEPTESESKAELDRFIEAMIAIRDEIHQVEQGVWPTDNNPLKHAPHTQADLIDEEWHRPYTRQTAAFPLPWIRDNKFWPFVNRIDDVYGDRHLSCSTLPMKTF